MTFPTLVQSRPNRNSGTTSPTSLNTFATAPTSGNRLIGLLNFGTSIGLTGFTTPAGWTALDVDITNNSILIEKISNGTEGTTLTVTFSSSGVAAALEYWFAEFSGSDSAVAPQFAVTRGVSSATFDPPSLSPTWGSADVTWFAIVMTATGESVTTAPTGYTNNVVITTNPGFAAYKRNNTTATENPSAFTLAGSTAGNVYTIAVKPAAITFTESLAVTSTSATLISEANSKKLAIASTSTTTVAKSVSRLLAAISASLTAVSAVFTGGGTNHPLTLFVTSTSATGAVKAVVRLLGVVSTSAAATTTGVAKILGVASTSATSLAKAFARTLPVASTSATAIAKAAARRLSVASTSATAAAKAVTRALIVLSTSSTAAAVGAGKVMAVLSFGAASVLLTIGKVLGVTGTSATFIISRAIVRMLGVASIGLVSALKAITRALTAGSTSATTVQNIKAAYILLLTALGSTTGVSRAVGQSFSVLSTSAVALRKAARRSLAVASSSASASVWNAGLVIDPGVTSFSAPIVIGVAKLLAAHVTGVPVLRATKNLLRMLTVASSSAVSAGRAVTWRLAVTVLGTVLLAPAGAKHLLISITASSSVALGRGVAKIVAIRASGAVLALKGVARQLSVASTTTTATFKRLGLMVSAVVASTSGVGRARGYGVLLTAGVSSAISFARGIGKIVTVRRSIGVMVTRVTGYLFRFPTPVPGKTLRNGVIRVRELEGTARVRKLLGIHRVRALFGGRVRNLINLKRIRTAMKIGDDFSPADPGESEIYTFDFCNDFAAGEVVVSAAWTCAVVDSDSTSDPSPGSRLSGSAVASGTQTSQRVLNLVPGNQYRLEAMATTNLGNLKSLYAHVSCLTLS